MRPTLALAAPVLLLAACVVHRAPAPSSDAASASTGPLVTSLQIAATADSVRLTLQATNSTQAPLAVEFRSGQTYDFTVADGTRIVWHWADGRLFTQALRTVTLAPGETRAWSEVWRPDAALHGRLLTARADLTSSNHPAARTQSFRLP